MFDYATNFSAGRQLLVGDVFISGDQTAIYTLEFRVQLDLRGLEEVGALHRLRLANNPIQVRPVLA